MGRARGLTEPLTDRTVHLCVDMRRLFSDDGPWPTPWLDRTLPTIVEIAERHPANTVFTRFIPPESPETMPGQWQRFYDRWHMATRAHLPPALLELLEPLRACVPPAVVLDKPVYSPFHGRRLPALLLERRADALVVTGAETDMCVLATVLGAIDLGYRVVLVTDAVCSSSDTGHDALMTLFRERFTEQMDVVTAEEVLDAWPSSL
jgi:nicotinamidase-related amidase